MLLLLVLNLLQLLLLIFNFELLLVQQLSYVLQYLLVLGHLRVVQAHLEADVIFHRKHIILTLRRFALLRLLILNHRGLVLTLLLLTLRISRILLLIGTYLLLITTSLVVALCLLLLLIGILHLFFLNRFDSLLVGDSCLVRILRRLHDNGCHRTVRIVGLALIWNILWHGLLCHSLRLILHWFLLNSHSLIRIRDLPLRQLPLLGWTLRLHGHNLLLLIQLILLYLLNLIRLILLVTFELR